MKETPMSTEPSMPSLERSIWRNPSGFTLPAPRQSPSEPVRHEQREARADGWRWAGRIIARAWPVGFDEREYRLLLSGGRARRVASPDGVTRDGRPLYLLSDAERRARDRAMNRHALDVYETHNIACNGGRTALLNYVGNVGGLTGIQYFAVGTGAIPSGQSGPLASDTTLWTEFYRQTLFGATVSGGQVDLSCIFGAGSGNATYTNAGIFGDGATGTANSGVLFAKALYSYAKSISVVLTNDYLISLA